MGFEHLRKPSTSEYVRLPAPRIVQHSVLADEENAYQGILPDSQEFDVCRQIRDFGEEVKDPATYYKEKKIYVPYIRNRDRFSDKFTLGSRKCLVAVFLARSQMSPSRLTSEVYHMQPGLFAPDFNGGLRRDNYENQMLVLNNHIAVPGSVDVTVAGGSIMPELIEDFSPEQMPDTAALWLSDLNKRYLDAETLAIPPKQKKGYTSVYVDTEKREVHVINHTF